MNPALQLLIGIALLILGVSAYGFDFVGMYLLIVVANLYLKESIGNIIDVEEWI